MKDNRHLSPLGAWALAFGCVLGWDSFVMPWTTFLPKAGPLGTLLGLLVGGAVMLALAWNIHFMANRADKPGGLHAYVSETFGADHGFLCAWFLAFAYIAICWMDAAVLAYFMQHVWDFGFWFGIHYKVAGYEVGLGHIVLSAAALAIACAVCCRRRLAVRVQICMALLLGAGVVACFLAAAIHQQGGLRAMAPAFVPGGGSIPAQVAAVVAISPWLFIGFESVSFSAGEFRFPRRKMFAVMAAAIATAVAAYALLSLIPPLAPTIVTGRATWPEAVAILSSAGGGASAEDVAFATAGRSFHCVGKSGLMITFLTFIAAVYTNLIGNTIAASRILAALADSAALPAWFGRRNADGAPRNAILLVAVFSVFVFALGETVIDTVVDIAAASVCVIYAYVSAATVKTARAERSPAAMATGLFGVAVSIALVLHALLPNFASDGGKMSAVTCFVLVLWCVAGQLAFYLAFRRDRNHRFGRSPLVWNTLFGVILLLSLMWVRKSTGDITQRALDNVIAYHERSCPWEDSEEEKRRSDELRRALRNGRETMNRAIMSDSLVQAGVTVFSLLISFALFSVMRRRERDLEREKAKAKSFFFSTVSHDIRTPLNAIIGFSEILKAGPKTEAEREQAVDSILVSGKTLLGLINDVLDLSKLESGRMEINLEPTDCPRLLHRVMDAFHVSGDKPGMDLLCEVEDMPALMLDPQRLRQIVFNLVGNAVKFTEKGHVTLRAAYERPEDAETGVFRLSVEDTGCGIAEEDQKRICSAYVQVGAKLARNGGTGRGLAICTQLVKAMGGELKVKSELGKGSTFEIEIPDVRSTVLPEAPASAAPGEALPGASAAPPRPVHRILLVDDSKMNLMVLKALLKKAGNYETTLAMDGQEALKVLEAPGAKPYDLVLTDMWMPNLDGEGLVKDIRANSALSSLRVLVVTADVEIRNKAAEMGFDGILLKPITTAALEQTLSGKGGDAS